MISSEMREYLEAVRTKIKEEDLSWESGITSLMNLSEDELSAILGACVLKWDVDEIKRFEKEAIVFDESEKLPSAFDWRNVNGKSYVTPVKNQGGCGSCVAFATIAAVETKLRIACGCPMDAPLLPTLSEANAYFCHGGNCKGRTLKTVLDYIMSGVVPEEKMPYFVIKRGSTIECYTECAKKRGTASCRIKDDMPDKISTSLYRYSRISGIENMKRAIVKYGSVIAAFVTGRSIITYTGGVYLPLRNEDVFSDHAVCLIGYNDDESCFIFKNSWGSGWGDGGFGKLSYNAEIYSYAYIPDAFSKVYTDKGDLCRDVFMRKNPYDFGQSGFTGNRCFSPDIIPSRYPIEDFCNVLRNRWNEDRGTNLINGMNYIYTRSRNLNYTEASLQYDICLYYCKGSLLMYPSQWKDNLIGTSTEKKYVTVHSTYFGEAAVTPEAFVWQAPELPPNQHYSLIANIAMSYYHEQIPDIDTIDEYVKFITTTSGYVCRNVSLVERDISEYSEVLFYEQGKQSSEMYFLIEGGDDAPIGAFCSLYCESNEELIDCSGSITKKNQAIMTFAEVPENFKGNLVFTYRSNQFKKESAWSLSIRAVYIPKDGLLRELDYMKTIDLPEESLTVKKGFLVGEYTIKGQC